MDALASMQSFLRSRPSKFKSLDFAIEWSVRSGQIRNSESARVSMPGQLKSLESGKCGTKHVGEKSTESEASTAPRQPLPSASSIAEEEEEGDAKEAAKPDALPPPSASAQPKAAPNAFTWRIDLTKTEKHWPGWFTGLSNNFLSVPAAKLLLLAGVDRLDRDLTVGQMQGKFQMQVLPQAGHAVHEDVPDSVADLIATFMVRNKFAEQLEEFQMRIPSC